MKLYVKFLMFAMVLAMMGPFLLKGSDGRPLMSIDEMFSGEGGFSTGIAKAVEMFNMALNMGKNSMSSEPGDQGETEAQDVAGKTKVHRWKDENGVWQFSDANTSGSTTEVVYINPNTNILQFNDLEKLKKLQAEQQKKPPPKPQAQTPAPGVPSVGQAMQTMQQAQQLQESLNKRAEQQQQMLNNL